MGIYNSGDNSTRATSPPVALPPPTPVPSPPRALVALPPPTQGTLPPRAPVALPPPPPAESPPRASVSLPPPTSGASPPRAPVALSRRAISIPRAQVALPLTPVTSPLRASVSLPPRAPVTSPPRAVALPPRAISTPRATVASTPIISPVLETSSVSNRAPALDMQGQLMQESRDAAAMNLFNSPAPVAPKRAARQTSGRGKQRKTI
jgi:hypothetical protein